MVQFQFCQKKNESSFFVKPQSNEKTDTFYAFRYFTKHTYQNHNPPFKALLIFTRIKCHKGECLIVYQAYSRSKFQSGHECFHLNFARVLSDHL
ncbi:hypothetical protein Hanom_Chr13g01195571 [Helianthus anomalus]